MTTNFGIKFLIHKVYKKVCDRNSPAKVQPLTAAYLRSKKKNLKKSFFHPTMFAT